MLWAGLAVITLSRRSILSYLSAHLKNLIRSEAKCRVSAELEDFFSIFIFYFLCEVMMGMRMRMMIKEGGGGGLGVGIIQATWDLLLYR